MGYDEVDIERFGKMGIAVCNTPDYGTREVADHAIALMMTLAKSIAYHDAQLRTDLKANWRPAHNPFGRRLSVCTFGVVGMGRIGTAAARRAKAFDMDVVFTIHTNRTAMSLRSVSAAPTRWPSLWVNAISSASTRRSARKHAI